MTDWSQEAGWRRNDAARPRVSLLDAHVDCARAFRWYRLAAPHERPAAWSDYADAVRVLRVAMEQVAARDAPARVVPSAPVRPARPSLDAGWPEL